MCVPALAALPGLAGAASGSGFLGGLSGIASSFGGWGTVATAASTAVAGYSAVKSGNAAQAAAEATAKQNDAAARDSIRQGEDESDRQRRAGAAVLAQQRVAMAANGVDASGATAIEMLDDTKAAIEDDAFAIRKNATNQARNFTQSAVNARVEGDNAASAGRWGAAGSLLSGGAKVGAKYSQWARERGTPGYA